MGTNAVNDIQDKSFGCLVFCVLSTKKEKMCSEFERKIYSAKYKMLKISKIKDSGEYKTEKHIFSYLIEPFWAELSKVRRIKRWFLVKEVAGSNPV